MALRLLWLSCGVAACRSENAVSDDDATVPAPDTDLTMDSDCVTTEDMPDPEPQLVTEAYWRAGDGLLPDEGCGLWVLDDSSEPEDPILMPNELDLGNDTAAERLGYHQSADVLDFPDVVEIVVSMHIVETDQPGIQQAEVSIQLGDADRKAVFVIAPGVVFLRASDTARGDVFADVSEQRATYLMTVDTRSQLVAVYRSGSLLLTGSTYATGSPVDDEIAFGELSTNSLGTSHWSSVAHNALRPTLCQPPNPCAR